MNDADFFDLVKHNFAFLIDGYGFQITDQQEIGGSATIEYCSEKIYVRVLKTPPDFEPRFVFGRIGVDGAPRADSFDWVDLGGLECCKDWKWQRQDREPYAGRVSQLARLLQECGQDCLNANPHAFAEMEQRRTELRAQHVEEEHVLAVRQQAEEAWRKKDFQSVASLYAEIQDQLTAAEQSRQSYATKQVSAAK